MRVVTIFALAFLLASYKAYAGPPAPPKPPAELHFTLDPADVLLISDALGNLPYRRAPQIQPLLRKMQAQINAQVIVPAIKPKRKP